MNIRLQRLLEVAPEDLGAREEVCKILLRRGDVSLLQPSVDVDPAWGRSLAWRLTSMGHPWKIFCKRDVTPTMNIKNSIHFLWEMSLNPLKSLGLDSEGIHLVVADLHINILWGDRRARLFAYECLSRGADVFDVLGQKDIRIRGALEAARLYSLGESTEEELEAALRGAQASALQRRESRRVRLWRGSGRNRSKVGSRSRGRSRVGLIVETLAEAVGRPADAQTTLARWVQIMDAALQAAAFNELCSASDEKLAEERMWQQKRLLGYYLGRDDFTRR